MFSFIQFQFAAMLTQSSNIFQRLAIGWEQMDYEKTDSYYKDQFTSTTFRMKNVRFKTSKNIFLFLFIHKFLTFFYRYYQTLCQLEQYLAEKRMPPAPNPTRAIMPNELRSITAASQRDERNFRILKEYVNALEYYADGFEYFKTSLPQKTLMMSTL